MFLSKLKFRSHDDLPGASPQIMNALNLVHKALAKFLVRGSAASASVSSYFLDNLIRFVNSAARQAWAP